MWLLNPYRFGAALLLDLYPSAAAAYSLRLLRSAYTGPVVRVRRSSDNTEQDFTAARVGDGTLTAFCGAGNGFVRTWYDQSGGNYHANQSDVTLQPRIVTNGALETVNGKPAIYTNITNVETFGLFASIAGFNAISNLSVFSQVTPVNGTSPDQFATLGLFLFGSPNTNGLVVSDATGVLAGETITINFADGTPRRLGSSTYTRSPNTQSIFSSFHLSTGTSIFANGSQITLNLSSGMTTTTAAAPANTGSTSNTVGLAHNSGLGRPMLIQEFIFYPVNQLANRTAIEANFNSHYNTF